MPAHGMQTPGNHPVSQVRRGPEVLFKDLRRDEIRGWWWYTIYAPDYHTSHCGLYSKAMKV